MLIWTDLTTYGRGYNSFVVSVITPKVSMAVATEYFAHTSQVKFVQHFQPQTEFYILIVLLWVRETIVYAGRYLYAWHFSLVHLKHFVRLGFSGFEQVWDL